MDTVAEVCRSAGGIECGENVAREGGRKETYAELMDTMAGG